MGRAEGQTWRDTQRQQESRETETSKTQGTRGDVARLGPRETRPQIEGQDTGREEDGDCQMHGVEVRGGEEGAGGEHKSSFKQRRQLGSSKWEHLPRPSSGVTIQPHSCISPNSFSRVNMAKE